VFSREGSLLEAGAFGAFCSDAFNRIPGSPGIEEVLDNRDALRAALAFNSAALHEAGKVSAESALNKPADAILGDEPKLFELLAGVSAHVGASEMPRLIFRSLFVDVFRCIRLSRSMQ